MYINDHKCTHIYNYIGTQYVYVYIYMYMYIYIYVYTYIYIVACLQDFLKFIWVVLHPTQSNTREAWMVQDPCLPSSGRTLVEINRLVQGNIYRKPWVFATKKTGQLPEIFPTNSLLISMIELLCAGVLGWFVSLGTLDLG